MDVELRTPHDLFNGPVRFVVPPYQRRYVWSQEAQWEPLWADVLNLAEQLAPSRGRSRKNAKPIAPHFLGSIVVQPSAESTDRLPVFAIVDGQQRLFTLQLLLDAVQQACEQRELGVAGELQRLVLNPAEHRTSNTNHDFKVWPTDEEDQEAFRHAMRNELSIKGYEAERIVEAHAWFADQVGKWLDGRPKVTNRRAGALHVALTAHLQLAKIELGKDDNEQVIFETLNSRGTPLGTFELAKNFLLQKAKDEEFEERGILIPLDEFKLKWWEREIGSGRTRRPHVEAFLHHWLTMETAKDIPLVQTFRFFRQYVSTSHKPITMVIRELGSSGKKYKELLTADKFPEESPEFSDFVRRWKTLQADVFTPVILYIWQSNANNAQVLRAYQILESYLVRRLIVGLDTRGYGSTSRRLLSLLKGRGRKGFDTVVRDYFQSLESPRERWPTSSDVQYALANEKLFGRASVSRIRMIFEAVESTLPESPWADNKQGLSKRKLSIEHIMPQHWQTENWAPPSAKVAGKGETAEQARTRLIHSFGNLTLVNHLDNNKLSNATWTSKCEIYAEDREKLALNMDLLHPGRGKTPLGWDEDKIRERSERLAKHVLKVWPRPA